MFVNEPMLDFSPESPERKKLHKTLTKMKTEIETNGPYEVPIVIGGKEIYTSNTTDQKIPFDHKKSLSRFSTASGDHVKQAISSSLEAAKNWRDMGFAGRAAIFLKAADLLTTKYRYEMMAATMIGQAKTTWQAEIDCVAELADFWRYYVECAYMLQTFQPSYSASGVWNKLIIRPLEGFVYAVSPFNFTAIAGALCSSPAIVGNTVIWKPSSYATYSNYLVFKILKEAGLPDGVINFVPGSALDITSTVLENTNFAGLHFTGSTKVFEALWSDIGSKIGSYKCYPRIVGETGGKNMHFVHESANINNAVSQTIRGAFEYSGQKCSATSRLYVPDTIWPKFKDLLLENVNMIKFGPVYDYTNFTSSVINKAGYDRISGAINAVGTDADPNTKIIAGGKFSDEEGYYIHPTVLLTEDPTSPTIVNELFGPVLTVYVYKASEFEKTLSMAANETTPYSLTGSLFAQDASAISKAKKIMEYACGNMYINDKCTGAVIAQQPFGGSRKSGTNDKAGSIFNIIRWVSPLSLKENMRDLGEKWAYPSNLP